MSDKKTNWTNEQIDAIEAKDNAIVVSAAAGSGKTAVLVERVIRKITDKENPISIEDLIIVTFTVAATMSMKEKIKKALRKLIKENPNDEHLKNQLKKLPFARISTIDSFCQTLVKENFQSLNISPDYNIGSDATLDLMKKEVLEELLEEKYSESDKDFLFLARQMTNGKNDNNIEDTIVSLFEYSSVFAFPENFFDLIIKNYEDKSENNIIYQEMLSTQDLIVNTISEKYKKALSLIVDNGKKEEKLTDYLQKHRELISNTNKKELYKITFDRMPATTQIINGAIIKKINDEIKTIVKDPILRIDKNSLFASFDQGLPYIKTLVGLAKEFSIRYKKLKIKNNVFSFNDILHFSIELLYDENQKPTLLAKELKDNIAEIMIDEYQDTNDAQDLLFKAISDSFKNSFIVGDIKQSIYGFRHAMPDIFSEKINNPKNKNIKLSYNFRSSANILNFVNEIFEKSMTQETCKINYSNGHELKTLSNEKGPKVKIEHISSGFREYKEKELDHVIKTVIKLHDEEKIEYDDICILFRANSGNIFNEYLKAFNEHNIPCVTIKRQNCMESYEFGVISSFLKIIENPTNDVAMLSVLTSPCYAFTTDEIAKIKLDKKFKNIISSLNDKKDNPKISNFLDELKYLKEKSLILSVSKIVRFIYEYKRIPELFSCVKSRDISSENLTDVLNFVESYDYNNSTPISAFLYSLNKIQESQMQYTSKRSAQTGKGVKIMTIHASKGLEFPYVILPGISAKTGNNSKSNDMILDKDFGLSIKYRDFDTFSVQSTPAFEIFKLRRKNIELAEELRVFYVAMTRAIKNLHIIVSGKSVDDDFILAQSMIQNNKPFTYDIQNSNYFKNILLAGIANDVKFAGKTEIDFKSESDLSDIDSFEFKKAEQTDKIFKTEANDIYLNEKPDKIEERLTYKYPFEALTQIPAKITASGFNIKMKKENFAKTKPEFLTDEKKDTYYKGNAYHTLMHYADLGALSLDCPSEINKLCKENILSPEEKNLIDENQIKKFTESDLYDLIINSDDFYREYQFAVNIEAKDLYEDVKSDDTLFVHGVFDAVIENTDGIIIVDYKTDFAKTSQELIDKYKEQIDIYRLAAEKIWDKKTIKTYLYSFYLGEKIEI